MASNRDPQKSYRTNRRGRRVTSSSTRAKRQNQSTVPKPTSSSTRANRRGSGVNKVTSDKDRVVKRTVGAPRGAQGPATPPQQGPSRRTPNVIGSKPPKSNTPPTQGAPKGNKISAQIKAGKTPPTGPKANLKPGMKGGGGQLRGLGTAALAAALSTGSLRNPVSKAKQKEAEKSIGKFNTKDADGTIRSRLKVGPKKVGPKKVGEGKVGTVAQAFDKAFAQAKKAGKKTFTFKGKTYTTKTK